MQPISASSWRRSGSENKILVFTKNKVAVVIHFYMLKIDHHEIFINTITGRLVCPNRNQHQQSHQRMATFNQRPPGHTTCSRCMECVSMPRTPEQLWPLLFAGH